MLCVEEVVVTTMTPVYSCRIVLNGLCACVGLCMCTGFIPTHAIVID